MIRQTKSCGPLFRAAFGGRPLSSRRVAARRGRTQAAVHSRQYTLVTHTLHSVTRGRQHGRKGKARSAYAHMSVHNRRVYHVYILSPSHSKPSNNLLSSALCVCRARESWPSIWHGPWHPSQSTAGLYTTRRVWQAPSYNARPPGMS